MYDPTTYRADPDFDMKAHQKRYCWRRVAKPAIGEAERDEEQSDSESIELPEAA